MADALSAVHNLIAQASKYAGEAADLETAVNDHVDQASLRDLAELALDAQEYAAAFTQVHRWAKSRLGEILGPERAYRYGDTAFTGETGGGWVARDPQRIVDFAIAAGDPADVAAIFTIGSPKVSGIDKVARSRGLDLKATRRDLVRWKPSSVKGKMIGANAPKGWRDWYPTADGEVTDKPKEEPK